MTRRAQGRLVLGIGYGIRRPLRNHSPRIPQSPKTRRAASLITQNLIDTGVSHYGCEFQDGSVPPLLGDWEEADRRLAQHRPSLSPSVFPEENTRISCERMREHTMRIT